MSWSRQIELTLLVALVGCGGSATPIAIACGEKHACVLRDDGSIRCWGQWVGHASTPPAMAGPYSAIAAGFFMCALDDHATVTCWNQSGSVPGPDGSFVALSSGWQLACGLTSDGTARCRDLTAAPLTQDPPPSPEPLREVRVGWSGPCGLRVSDDSAICWAGSPAAAAPTDPLTALAVGASHACGVRSDGSLVCWGDPGGTPGVLTPPVGQFIDVKAEDASDCALGGDGSIACWGSWADPGFTGPQGTFEQFGIGEQFGCGMHAGGSVECWGYDDVGQASPPADLSR
jgi:hypothetical protein